jgi:hypothetical protein
MVGATECGQETILFSQYCGTHQPTSAGELTARIDQSTGGRIAKESGIPGESSGASIFITKPSGIK